jgi:hypothetical protein
LPPLRQRFGFCVLVLHFWWMVLFHARFVFVHQMDLDEALVLAFPSYAVLLFELARCASLPHPVLWRSVADKMPNQCTVRQPTLEFSEPGEGLLLSWVQQHSRTSTVAETTF